MPLVRDKTLLLLTICAQAIISGTYLYIDGGEISTWNGTGNGIFGGPGPCTSYYGFGCPGNITVDAGIPLHKFSEVLQELLICLADNNTYSIDLTTSWTNNTVVLNSIEKTAPVLKQGGLWADHSNTSFYAYGGVNGGPGGEIAIPPNELWEFMPSGGSGSWSQVQLTAQSENFTSLMRTIFAVDTSGNGIGFSLGGLLAESSDYGKVPVEGMVVYNSSSQIWYNASAPIDSSGTLVRGAAHFIPPFGPEGLAIFLAGGAPGTDVNPTDSLLTTAVVSIYEPISAQWRTLPVTGSSPPPNEGACIAGAQGENGTYEVKRALGRELPTLIERCVDLHVRWSEPRRHKDYTHSGSSLCPFTSIIPLATNKLHSHIWAHRGCVQYYK